MILKIITNIILGILWIFSVWFFHNDIIVYLSLTYIVLNMVLNGIIQIFSSYTDKITDDTLDYLSKAIKGGD